MTEKREVWYRYDDMRWSVTLDAEMEHYGTRLEVIETAYPVVKKTPKGAWLELGVFGETDKRWVGLGTGKRFAHPTRKEALEGYIHRKNRQIKIYEARLRDAQEFREMAQRKVLDIGGA